MNNVLTRAIAILGLAIDDVVRFGWMCGTLGHERGPKCVNGTISMAAGASNPTYLNHCARIYPGTRAPLVLVAETLIKVRPAWANDSHYIQAQVDQLEHLDLEDMANLLAEINDLTNKSYEPLLTEESVKAWYQRAIDVLTAQLPDPEADGSLNELSPPVYAP